jgi:hypothetical protein
MVSFMLFLRNSQRRKHISKIWLSSEERVTGQKQQKALVPPTLLPLLVRRGRFLILKEFLRRGKLATSLWLTPLRVKMTNSLMAIYLHGKAANSLLLVMPLRGKVANSLLETFLHSKATNNLLMRLRGKLVNYHICLQGKIVNYLAMLRREREETAATSLQAMPSHGYST